MHKRLDKPIKQNRKARNIPFAYINLVYNKSCCLNQCRSDDLKNGVEINGEPCGKTKTGCIPHIIYQKKFQMD